MKTPMFYKKSSLFFLLLLCAQWVVAQETFSKTIEKSYALPANGTLYVENKYGDVDVKGSDGDRLEIVMTVTVKDKPEEEASQLLERVQPEIKEMDNKVYLSSKILDKKGSALARYFNKANPLSTEKNNLQIDYSIHVPEQSNLNITNKYGDLIVDSVYGTITADIQHGNVWLNNDLEKAKVNLKFGKLRAESITTLDLYLKNAELALQSSKELKLISSGSEIQIDELKQLELNSSKDKMVLGSVESIRGELKFTVMDVNSLGESLSIDTKITDLTIARILAVHPTIVIEQESSDIEINVWGTEIRFNGHYTEGVVRLPKTFKNISSELIDKGKKIRTIQADYGKKSTGKIAVSGYKGSLVFKVAEWETEL